MASIKPGLYSVSQILDVADFDFAQANGDYRRVKIGKLGFDSLDDQILVPTTADSLEITLDENSAATLDIDSGTDQPAPAPVSDTPQQ